MQFEAILFDCDGVLVDSETIYVAVELEMLGQLGLKYELAEYQRRFMGLRSADYLGRLEADSLSRLSRGLPADFADRLGAASRERLMAELEPMDGAERLLDAISRKVAVASSSAPDLLHAKLHKTGLHAHLSPHIYSGEQVERGKPAPDLFLYAADRIGVEAERCLVIEDSVNGVRAGRAAGMTVWGFVGGGHVSEDGEQQLYGAGADAVFAHLDDVLMRLRAQRSR